ncbi:hypothetical protein PpBr36_09127 [Pyricularia pennisetigena]|uniref:hypothetical protein n=1 Tax=Pyricularia pennisetigena TaxID=1578925 RepID=UPI001151A5F2|nr:hypothetical protein PpBr36_09127 [Pyricularia pennisetigena]TLS23825.1 hypothetical protein PpBr36_09127 [Pyricularia pennisetigena]
MYGNWYAILPVRRPRAKCPVSRRARSILDTANASPSNVTLRGLFVQTIASLIASLCDTAPAACAATISPEERPITALRALYGAGQPDADAGQQQRLLDRRALVPRETARATCARSWPPRPRTRASWRPLIRCFFSLAVAETMQLPEGTPPRLDVRLMNYVIDFSVAVDLRAWFLREFEVSVPVLSILNGESIRELCKTVLSQMQSK